jgi:putative flippase GtrA
MRETKTKQALTGRVMKARHATAHHLQGWRSTGFQILRYCLVGGVNTLIDISVLNILLWRDPSHNASLLLVENSVAYASGAVSSLFLNKHWTFRRKQRPTRREVRRFLTSLALELVSSNGFLWLAGRALSPFISNVTLWANASKLLTVAANTVLSYLIMRFWIFASDTPEGAIRPGRSPTDRRGIRKLLNRRERNLP